MRNDLPVTGLVSFTIKLANVGELHHSCDGQSTGHLQAVHRGSDRLHRGGDPTRRDGYLLLDTFYLQVGSLVAMYLLGLFT